MSPYTVELHLSRSVDDSVRADRFDLELVDGDRTGTSARRKVGIAFLDLRAQVIPGIDLSIERFLDRFLGGNAGTQEDGLRFGQHLLGQLLSDLEVRLLWDEIQGRRRAQKRPLRLELILPADDAGVVSDVPFELLADETGFLFRQSGAALVRAIRKLPVRAVELDEGGAVLVAWANPKTAERLPQALFDQHEESTARAAEAAGLAPREPCRRATLAALEERLSEETAVVSLIAHGDTEGGAAWFHQPDDGAYPDDLGAPVEARDLARVFRRGKVKLALLWTCYSGRHNALSGALASTLLQEEHGDVAAVVASHAALRAESTAKMVGRFFGSLRAPAGGDVERALGEARLALGETDLQWAAPVYYARPSGGRSVTLAMAAESLREVAPRAGEVERAPDRSVHFRGRDDEVARGMAYLRTGRLVSVTGLPGMGKTEVTLEVARQAAVDPSLGLARVLWLALDRVTRAESLRATLASAFGAAPDQCPDDAALARRIGDTRALVVLDNTEDPIRADRGGMRALLDTLLRECGGFAFLLATRERLGDLPAATEHEVHVPQLRKDDARAVFLSVAGERLSLEERALPQLDGLLAWVDGHPLSLVLVARQVGTMRLPELLRRLETKGVDAVHAAELFGEEATGGRDERLTRLASSLSLSYLPLAEKVPGAAEMFAWLGHLPAGLPEVMVPFIFGEDGAERRAILLRRGLAEEVGRERRLVLPAPVRAYARGRAGELTEGRRAELLEATFAAMAGWMNALGKRLGRPGARKVMDMAARDAENVSGLLTVVPPGGEGRGETLAEWIVSTVYALAQIMLHGGGAPMAVGIMRNALTSVERVAPSSRGPIAGMLNALGDLYARMDQLKDAEAAYVQALSSFRAIDDGLNEAIALEALGDLYVRTDRLKDAEAAYDQALPKYRANHARIGEANVLKALGNLYVRTDRLDDAEGAYDQALSKFRANHARIGEANVLLALGDLYRGTDRVKKAEAVYRQALLQFRAIDDRLGEANTHQCMGSLALDGQDAPEAFRRYLEALALHRQIGQDLSIAADHVYLGHASLAAGRLVRAVVLLATGLRFFVGIDDHFDIVHTGMALARAFDGLDREQEAGAAMHIAWSHAAAIDDPLAQQLAEQTGQPPPTAEEVQRAEALLAAAISTCEQDLAATCESLYFPLPPPSITLPT